MLPNKFLTSLLPLTFLKGQQIPELTRELSSQDNTLEDDLEEHDIEYGITENYDNEEEDEEFLEEDEDETLYRTEFEEDDEYDEDLDIDEEEIEDELETYEEISNNSERKYYEKDIYKTHENIPKYYSSSENQEEEQKLKTHLDRYKNIVQNKKLLEELRIPGKLNIPVNLVIFENYYKQVSQYKYKETYTYNDKIFVLDKKQKYLLNHDKYKYSKNWLSNLNALKDYKYRNNHYGNHAIKEHINWVDGSSDSSSKLYKILDFDLSINEKERIESFVPISKKIIANYNYPHNERINLYSNYSIKNKYSSKLNFYKEINYGKLKNSPKQWNKVFDTTYLNKNNPSCDDLRNLAIKSVLVNYSRVDGYDGICDGYNLTYPSQDNLKFSTPYVAYRKANPYYWSTEYYFYNLGDFSNSTKARYSENLNSDESPKSVWYIDYSDLFSVDRIVHPNLLNPRLKINLNLDKIKEIENFLTISSAFNFYISFNMNGKKIEQKFNLEDVLSGREFEIYGMNKDSLFSNFSLKISKNTEFSDDIELISQDNNFFKYSVDTSKLLEKHLIFDRLEFRVPTNKNFFPFEFKNLERAISCFFLVSKNNKDLAVRIDKNLLEKLNLKISTDNKQGIVNIKYFDFLDKKEKEGVITNLLTFFKFSENQIFESKIDAKNYLKQKYRNKLNEYFWNNVDFVPINYNSFNDVNTFKFKFSFENRGINKTWDEFFKNIRINIKNHTNFAPTPIFSNFNNKSIYLYNSENIINDLFKLPTFLYQYDIQESDYKTTIINKNNIDKLSVSIKLESNKHPEYNGYKEYFFNKNYNPKLDSKLMSDEYKENDSKNNISKYGSLTVLSALGASGMGFGAIQLFNFFKKRQIIS